MKVAAAQIACVPGDISANLRKIRDFAARAKAGGAELVVFPEMSDTGYSMAAINLGKSQIITDCTPGEVGANRRKIP